MTWTNSLVDGLGTFLAAHSVGTYSSTAVTTATACAITLGPTLDEPIKSIGLMAYGGTADKAKNDAVQPVQIAIRGTTDVTSVDTIGDAIFDLLHGAHDLDIGGVKVILAWRNSALPGGRDAAQRWHATHNYYFQAARPTTSRTD